MRNTFTIFFLLLLMSCGSSNETYSELENKFPANKNLEAELIEVKTMTIVSKSNNVTNRYSGSTKLKLTSEFIEINVDSKGHEKIQIPIQSISGCEKTCFGPNVKSWSADILLGSHGTEISFEHNKHILPWCYDNGLPIVSKQEKRDWMDRGKELPTYENYQQVDKDEYERQIEKRCKGL